jgi:hypothetical protein
MGQTAKYDNASFLLKLHLRRDFLKKHHALPCMVFDACCGKEQLWSRLRQEFPCTYWGVDVKPGKGRIHLDSTRILAQPGWDFDVIDVDTFGAPWKHYKQICLNMPAGKTLTVFLTYGFVQSMGGAISKEAKAALGLNFQRLTVPQSLAARLWKHSVRYCLTSICESDILIEDAVQVSGKSNVTLYALRIRKINGGTQDGRKDSDSVDGQDCQLLDGVPEG